ncbi:TPA: secretion protein EspO [Escherichia albertii]
MPFSIKNIFSNSKGSYPEISGPIQDKPVQKNCILTSTTCDRSGYTVFSKKVFTFDMQPPGAGERDPRLKFSASELSWLSKTIETEIHNTKE